MTASPKAKPRGRPFKPGHPGGPGNPHGKTVAQYRSAILAATSKEDAVAVFRAMIEAAKGGDVNAAKVVLDRLLGVGAGLMLTDSSGEPVGVTFQIVRAE